MKQLYLKKRLVLPWVLIVVCFTALLFVIFLLILRGSNDKKVTNFQSCKNAGGVILESYPEQCMIDGKSFVNESQVSKGSAYVGLTEQAAMDTAAIADVPHRVVERDGAPLPATMDYVIGRLNFYVRNGEVYWVEVEGDE